MMNMMNGVYSVIYYLNIFFEILIIFRLEKIFQDQ
jgi:hypothetical protein